MKKITTFCVGLATVGVFCMVIFFVMLF